ncbi:MAG: hypothetical protein ABIJ00_16285 [Candidatus Eisenbacteria bacterium]
MSDTPDTANRGNDSSNEDAVLNRLIRMSRRSREEKFVRPDEETITAYLMGTATAAQKSVVMEALERSSAFRRELLAMAGDMQTLSVDQLEEIRKRSQLIRPPSYEEFLASRGDTAARHGDTLTLWARLVRWRIPQLYVPIAVAAAVIVLAIVKTGMLPVTRKPMESRVPGVAVGPDSTPQVIELAEATLVERGIEPGLLISNVTRGAAAHAAEKAYDTPKEAAMAAFLSMLTYDYGSGRFAFWPPPAGPTPTGHYRPTSLILVSEAGQEIQRVIAKIPGGGPEGDGKRLEAWAITFPSRDLYRIELQEDSTRVLWTPEMGDTACIALVAPADSGYKVVASELRLR